MYILMEEKELSWLLLLESFILTSIIMFTDLQLNASIFFLNLINYNFLNNSLFIYLSVFKFHHEVICQWFNKLIKINLIVIMEINLTHVGVLL